MKKIKFIIGLILALSTPAHAQVKDVTSGVYSTGFHSTPNYVKNPSCFANVSNITASGGSLTRSTTTPVFGVASCLIDASASAQTYKFSTNTLDNGLNGQNCEAQFTYTGDASLYKAYVEQPAATKVSQELTLTNAGSGARTASLFFPCGSNSNATILTIEATSNSAAAIRVGQAYVGLATGIGIVDPVGDWQTFTPTGSWVTNTTYTGRWRRVGEMAEYQIRVALSGAPTSAALTVNLASGHTIDTSKLASGTSGAELPNGDGSYLDNGSYYGLVKAFYSSTSAIEVRATASASAHQMGQVTQAAPITWANGDSLDFTFSVPISGWSSQSAVRADQTNYDWTSYTPSFNGWGTPTNIECQHKRDGADLLLRCKYTAGTTTGVEARVNLPVSLTSATTGRIPSIQKCGELVINATAASTVHVLCEPSVAYVTFGIQAAGSSGLSKALGNAFSSSIIHSFTARVPIDGWLESQNAPILVGSVTSGSSGAERIERAELNCDASSSITSQSGSWLSAIGNRSTAACSITVASGVFSSTPTCTFTVKAAAVQATAVNMTSATAGTVYGASADYDGYLICMGPR